MVSRTVMVRNGPELNLQQHSRPLTTWEPRPRLSLTLLVPFPGGWHCPLQGGQPSSEVKELPKAASIRRG